MVKEEVTQPIMSWDFFRKKYRMDKRFLKCNPKEREFIFKEHIAFLKGRKSG
jgi:hypothetical protein